ncbi:MAG: hypothetical protein GX961_09890, partial [Firmicutes bacterium]|nr:hypothetical protein [Bacillota bacterium]
EAARAWVEALLGEPAWRRLVLAGELAERDDLVEVLEGAVLWVRQVIRTRVGRSAGSAPAGQAAHPRPSLDELIELWRELREAYRLVQGPAQRRLVLDRLAWRGAGGGPGRGH